MAPSHEPPSPPRAVRWLGTAVASLGVLGALALAAGLLLIIGAIGTLLALLVVLLVGAGALVG